jgi:hypothetical protein
MRWTDEKIKDEILWCIELLGIDRMPTSVELTKELGRNDLHLKICRTLTYKGWAEKLNLRRKGSDTLTGEIEEFNTKSNLEKMGFSVEKMSARHPFDLLINNSIKIDIKVSKIHNFKGYECFVFKTKQNAPCDLFICIGEFMGNRKIYVIPSKLVHASTLTIGKNSKYNQFIDRWDYLHKFNDFYKTIK